MRVAALSDIHGNLPALEAVLAELEREDVDAVVVAGDVASGPWPAETLERVVELDVVIVAGNTDRYIVEGRGALATWCADRLGPSGVRTVASWPISSALEVDGVGSVLACHSTPSSDEVIYTPLTPDADLEPLFAAVPAETVVCGHTHAQYVRVLPGGLRLVNPGSVGMPNEDSTGAFWALLGHDVELRRTEYDVEATAAAARESGAPFRLELLRDLVEAPGARAAWLELEKARGA